jgi:hypothetical protein
MLIECKFVIRGKKKIAYGLGIAMPEQEVYNLLRENGFYDLHVEEVK